MPGQDPQDWLMNYAASRARVTRARISSVSRGHSHYVINYNRGSLLLLLDVDHTSCRLYLHTPYFLIAG